MAVLKVRNSAGAWVEIPGFLDPHPVVDTTALVKGSADSTKLIRLEADDLTSGQTRVLTMADQNIDLTPGTGSFPASSAVALLAGRSGGQTIIGGTESGDDLELQSTSDPTKGSILLSVRRTKFGLNTTDNPRLDFLHSSANGDIQWLGGSDYFHFSDDILLNDTEKLFFADTGNYIHQPAAGELKLTTPNATIDFTANKINFTVTDLQHGGTAIAKVTDFNQACRVYHSSAQTITTATSTALAFNSERYDTDTMHDNSTNNSRITFTTAGKYTISGHVRFDTSTAGLRRFISIRLNGSTVIALQMLFPSTVSGSAILSISTTDIFSASDYVELIVNQNTGGDLDVTSTSNYSPEFSAHRLS